MEVTLALIWGGGFVQWAVTEGESMTLIQASKSIMIVY